MGGQDAYGGGFTTEEEKLIVVAHDLLAARQCFPLQATTFRRFR